MSDEIRSEEPHDRLTKLCQTMIKALEKDPEFTASVKCVIMLDDDDTGSGGLVLHGYDDDMDAMANLFMHLRAVFRANGKDLMFTTMNQG